MVKCCGHIFYSGDHKCSPSIYEILNKGCHGLAVGVLAWQPRGLWFQFHYCRFFFSLVYYLYYFLFWLWLNTTSLLNLNVEIVMKDMILILVPNIFLCLHNGLCTFVVLLAPFLFWPDKNNNTITEQSKLLKQEVFGTNSYQQT